MGDIKSVMHGDVEIISSRALGKLIQTNNLINRQETTRQSQEAEREAYYNKYKVYVPYNNGSTYYLANKVTYNGSSFQCKVEETTGNAPASDGTDNTQWMCISKKGDKGDAGGDITNASQLPITDTGNYYTTDDTNSALQEIASRVKENKNDLIERGVNIKYPPAPIAPAIGDGITDDTTALISCITLAGIGGIVYFPKGIYRITNKLVLPKGLQLIGTRSELAPQYYDNGWDTSKFGSVIAVDFGSGSIDDDNSALLLTSFNIIDGVNFWYPSQSGSTLTPLLFPPTLSLQNGDVEENNNFIEQVQIKNCVFVNPYIAINFVVAHELFILKNIKFTAWFRGILLDKSYDVDRLINIHSNINISYRGLWPGNNIFSYHISNNQTIAIVIGKCDQLYMSRVFTWGFTVGLQFSEISDAGNVNGCFVNQSGFEGCALPIAILGETCRRISFQQCMGGVLPDFNSSLPSIWVTRTNHGERSEIRFTDFTSFISSGEAIILKNQEDVTLNNCHFYNSLSKEHAVERSTFQIESCKDVVVENCTFELNNTYTNSLFYSIIDSNMITLQDTKFIGYKGAIGTSSSTIVNSTHIRVKTPKYSNSNDTTTYQTGSSDVVISDLISY